MKVNSRKFDLALARICMNMPKLAEKADLPYQTVVNARAGHKIKPATLGKIAAALGVDAAEIMED